MRILQAFIADDNGGLTKYILTNYKYMKKYGVKFDFLTYERKKLSFENELIESGAKVFHLTSVFNICFFCKEINTILKNNEYNIIHFNMSYANFVPILILKLMLTKDVKIIIHSHSMGLDEKNKIIKILKTCVHKIGKLVIPVLCDGFLSCSSGAGNWMYIQSIRSSKIYRIAHNAIDVSPFVYNEDVRLQIRKELKLSPEDIVIGHVGRFTYQKNHEFIIDIFKKCVAYNRKYKLLLIGDGPNKTKIENMIREYKLEENVLLLGIRNDIPDLLQGIDVFCLPSRFEGLPIVGVEAQASGVYCLVSSEVSTDLAITRLCNFLPLENRELWVECIIKLKKYKRMDTSNLIRSAGYEINTEINEMIKYYNQFINN